MRNVHTQQQNTIHNLSLPPPIPSSDRDFATIRDYQVERKNLRSFRSALHIDFQYQHWLCSLQTAKNSTGFLQVLEFWINWVYTKLLLSNGPPRSRVQTPIQHSHFSFTSLTIWTQMLPAISLPLQSPFRIRPYTRSPVPPQPSTNSQHSS